MKTHDLVPDRAVFTLRGQKDCRGRLPFTVEWASRAGGGRRAQEFHARPEEIADHFRNLGYDVRVQV